MKSLQQRDIASTIKRFVAKYIEKYDKKPLHNGGLMKCSSPYDINNGFCDDFADDLVNALRDKGNKNLFVLSGDMFFNQRDDVENFWEGELIDTPFGIWSKEMLDTYGQPPVDLMKVDDEILHTWIFYNGKHYDAEVPEGVNYWHELPLCKKFFNYFN